MFLLLKSDTFWDSGGSVAVDVGTLVSFSLLNDCSSNKLPWTNLMVNKDRINNKELRGNDFKQWWPVN